MKRRPARETEARQFAAIGTRLAEIEARMRANGVDVASAAAELRATLASASEPCLLGARRGQLEASKWPGFGPPSTPCRACPNVARTGPGPGVAPRGKRGLDADEAVPVPGCLPHPGGDA